VLARGDDERPPARRRPEADLEVATDLEPPLDRVDQATFAGRRLAEELHDLLVHHGVTCGRLQIAARTDDGTDLVRTWRTDLGGWGGLTPARITDRVRWQLEGWLSASAVATARSHRAGAARAANLRAHRGEELLPDAVDVPEVPPVALVRLAVTALDVAAAGAEQGRLWGGPSGGDLRAHRALDRVQAAVGGTGLLAATLQGGRDVREQVHVRPWGEQSPPPRPLDRPWPGRLPDPAPATVCTPAEPVEVRDPAGVPVRVDVRTGLSGPPARVRWRPSEESPHAVDERQVTGWAGPWLLSPRWWASDGTGGADGAQGAGGAPGAGGGHGVGLRGHLQVAFDDGTAVLLACDAQGWTCEARYD
jgi:protein ImuB